MTYDYGRHGGFMYQQLLSLYIHVLLRGKYRLNNSNKVSEDYKEFRGNIKKFKQDILHRNFSEEERTYDFDSINNTKDRGIEILLEGDGECFEDINLLKNVENKENDMHIFIQAKAKGENLSNIGVGDGILKTLKNFQKNINFQNYKHDEECLFYIFVNKKITKKVLSITNKTFEGYLTIVDYIINENLGKKEPNPKLPLFKLNKLDGEFNLSLIRAVLDGTASISDFPGIKASDFDNICNLVLDIDIILANMKIISSIKTNILEDELEKEYPGNLGNEMYVIQKKSGGTSPVLKTDTEFEKYKEYEHTYYKYNIEYEAGGMKASELETIDKGKFL